MNLTRASIALTCFFCSLTQVHAQSPAFEGSVQGIFINPSSGVVEGLGTNQIRFPDSSGPGVLTFTPSQHYTSMDQPFLLGKVDFLANGTPPEQITFRARLETSGTDGSKGSVSFCPPVKFTEFAEPGFRTLLVNFAPDQAWTSNVQGTNYTLAFAGVTPTTTWTENADTILPATVGQEAVAGFLWASLKTGGDVQSNGSGNGCCECDCGPPPGVPEPSTFLMIAMGLFAMIAIRYYSRGANPSNDVQV